MSRNISPAPKSPKFSTTPPIHQQLIEDSVSSLRSQETLSPRLGSLPDLRTALVTSAPPATYASAPPGAYTSSLPATSSLPVEYAPMPQDTSARMAYSSALPDAPGNATLPYTYSNPRLEGYAEPPTIVTSSALLPPGAKRLNPVNASQPYYASSMEVRQVPADEEFPEQPVEAGHGARLVEHVKTIGGHIADTPYHLYSAGETVGTTVRDLPQNYSAEDFRDGVLNIGSAAADRVSAGHSAVVDAVTFRRSSAPQQPDDNVYVDDAGRPATPNRLQAAAGHVQTTVGPAATYAADRVQRGANYTHENVLRPGAKHAWNGFDWLAGTLHKGGKNIGEGVYAGTAITSDGLEKGNVGIMFLICGIFGLTMLVMIPIWDGAALLSNPEWKYLYGILLPVLLIVFSLLIPIAFAATVVLLLRFGKRSGSRSEETFFGAAILFVLLLGTLLVTFSSPIAKNALAGASAFTSGCKTNLKTKPLFSEYEKLSKLRSTADCAKEWSITKCKGFTENKESKVLQNMEQHLGCSGFCWDPHVDKASQAAGKKTGKFLLQLESEELAKRRAGASITAENATVPASSYYPPALFSKVKYAASCNAMAARDMSSFVGDMSKQLMYEGLFLIAASVIQGFLMIAGLITKKEQESLQKALAAKHGRESMDAIAGYGATQDPMASGDFRRRQFAQ